MSLTKEEQAIFEDLKARFKDKDGKNPLTEREVRQMQILTNRANFKKEDVKYEIR